MPGKSFARSIVAAAALTLGVPIAATTLPQALNVKLGTIAPDNSPWTNALRTMGSRWEKDTQGRVRLTLYAGSIPSDSSVVSRMRLNSLQAGTLFVAGLGEIDPAFNVVGIPFFYESQDELAFVQKELGSMLEQKLSARGFRLLAWANGGWVRLFSKSELKTVTDIQRAKLYTTEGDDKSLRWYADADFNAVPLPTSSIPVQLKSPVGSINAAPSPPVYAAATGFYKDAPYMLDVKLGAFTTATLITEKAWAGISAADQEKVLAAARAMATEVTDGAEALDDRYVTEMKKDGLKVTTLTPTELAAFRATADKITATQRGTVVPADVYDAAVRARAKFRASGK